MALSTSTRMNSDNTTLRIIVRHATYSCNNNKYDDALSSNIIDCKLSNFNSLRSHTGYPRLTFN